MITLEEYTPLRARYDAFEAWRAGRQSYQVSEVPSGLYIDNTERGAIELFEFMRDKPQKYFCYVRYPGQQRGALPCPRIVIDMTTWTGDLIASGPVQNVWHDNFGGRRVSFRARCVDGSGVVYSGTHFYSADH